MPAGALAFCLMLGVFFVMNPSRSIPPNSLQQLALKNNQAAEQVALLESLTNTEELEVMSDPAFLMWAEEESIKEKMRAYGGRQCQQFCFRQGVFRLICGLHESRLLAFVLPCKNKQNQT